MDPVSLRSEFRRIISLAADELWPDRIPPDFRFEVSDSDNPSFGDLSCQSALRLAGILGENPREIAEAIADRIGGTLPGVSRISVDGPGFVNFTLSLEYLSSVSAMLAEQGLGSLIPDNGERRTVLVEFVSSNPTGPLNVGHCRQAVLGEAISSLLESTGWDVSREYYFNDTGRQMLLLGESLAVRYSDEGDDPPIPEGGYRGEYLCQWAADLRKVSGPDLTWKENSDTFISFAMDRAMDSIRSDLDLLGIRFDRFFSESELIPDAVQKTIDRLARTEVNGQSLIFSDPDGSGKIWLRFTALGRPEDRVIVRGNGMYTYRMPDIAYHIDKFERGYQMMIDVFGADHHDTAQDVGAALEALLGKRCVSSRLKVIIHQFVTLIRGGVKVKMSTRAGEFVTIKDLVSEAGSVDVTKYLFLTRRAEAHMDFDLDIAKMESNENPVYYVQYAHARIAGVMRTATEAGITLPDFDSTEIPSLLKGKHQRELMRLLEMVPSRVGAAAESLEPHRLTEILAMLATGFHRFYQHVRIVDPENPMVSSARLMLCEACRKSISGLLEILGVSAPERM